MPTPHQPAIGARVKPTVEVDGLTFRDLDGDGQLTPYEDWRLPAAARAADLVSRMTLEEKAGLMLIDSLNARFGGAMARYGPDYLDDQHMRRFIFRNAVVPTGDEEQGDDDHVLIAGSSVTPTQAATFLNAVQEHAEASRLGIPALFKSNARNHIDPDARAGSTRPREPSPPSPRRRGSPRRCWVTAGIRRRLRRSRASWGRSGGPSGCAGCTATWSTSSPSRGGTAPTSASARTPT